MEEEILLGGNYCPDCLKHITECTCGKDEQYLTKQETIQCEDLLNQPEELIEFIEKLNE